MKQLTLLLMLLVVSISPISTFAFATPQPDSISIADSAYQTTAEETVVQNEQPQTPKSTSNILLNQKHERSFSLMTVLRGVDRNAGSRCDWVGVLEGPKKYPLENGCRRISFSDRTGYRRVICPIHPDWF